jgi:hypothetical protein
MLTVLILTIGASILTVYHYWSQSRHLPLQTTVWNEGHLVTLNTHSAAPLHIAEAWWYSHDITAPLQLWCQDTSHVAFMATDQILTDITSTTPPLETTLNPYLTVIYQ